MREDFIVIDPVFPQRMPFTFRNSEINEYFARVRNFSSYAMHPMLPGPEAWFGHGYGVSKSEYNQNKQGYLRHYPQNKNRIHYLNPYNRYEVKLAYSFFLAETYVLLPFYEKHQIPFVFVLYPGGSFGLDLKESDNMLRRLFESPCFRKVIVTEQITFDYLTMSNLCAPDRIGFVHGNFVQFKKADVTEKLLYKRNKSTFDICFVAIKHSEKGVDKGYDLFIETAKILSKASDDIMFHVVGGFDENDIDTSEINDRLTFYGYQRPDFLAEFYSRMDIFLNPNRPNKKYVGNFDSFPMGIDAGYCGVALFSADELKMNHHYADKKDIVIVELDPTQIAESILSYYRDLDSFYALSREGQIKTQELFDIDYQIDQRLDIFNQFVRLEIHQPDESEVGSAHG